MLQNTQEGYGLVAKGLHGIMALTIITLLCVGFYMSDLPPSPDKIEIYGIHKAFGILTLILAIVRLLWRLSSIVPIYSAEQKYVKIEKIGVLAMYMLMFIMPISGASASLFHGRDINIFGLFIISHLPENLEIASFFGATHEICAPILASIIAGHIIAALYHKFFLKDKVMSKMF